MRLLCDVIPYIDSNRVVGEVILELRSLYNSLELNKPYTGGKNCEIDRILNDILYVKSKITRTSTDREFYGSDVLYTGRVEYLVGLGYAYNHVRSIRTLESLVREVLDSTWSRIEEETRDYLSLVNDIRSRMITSSLGLGVEYIHGSDYCIKTYDGYYGFEAQIRTSWRVVPVYLLWDLSNDTTFARIPAGEKLKLEEFERYFKKLGELGRKPSSYIMGVYESFDILRGKEYLLESDLDAPSFTAAANLIGTTGSGTQNIYIMGENITDLGSLDYMKVKENVLELEKEYNEMHKEAC